MSLDITNQIEQNTIMENKSALYATLTCPKTLHE